MELNFDAKKIITLFLPSNKRTNLRVRWLFAILKPLRDVHVLFLSYVAGVKEEMKWNGQLILLQRYLNLKYGSGIIIENQDFQQKGILGYPCPDERNVTGYDAENFNNPLCFGADEGFLSSVGFIVKVPSAIIFDHNEMRATIDFYQIGSSDYEIEII